MGSIDDLKKNLNLDRLDKDLRDKMYNKFVEKGGKVIQDKKKGVIKFDREQQKLAKEKERERLEAIKKTTSYRYSFATNQQQKKEGIKEKKRYFRVFLTGFYQGIFSISGKFSKKFSYSMYEDFAAILTELYQATEQVLNLDPVKKWEAMDMINVNSSLGYEIVLRINNLYKKDSINRISEYFKSSNVIICNSIIQDLKIYFKDLLILYPYWETTKQIVFEAEQVLYELTSVNPLIPKSKINKDIDRLFSYFFPRIFTVINYNIGTKVIFEYNAMFNFSKITPDIDIGSITKDLINQRKEFQLKKQKEKEEQLKKMKNESEVKSEENMPKYMQRGLSLINDLVLKIPDKVSRDTKGKIFESNEKMLELYYLVNNYDEEYSFIMTTSQIKFSPKLEYGTRIDIKSDLENLYIKYSEILSNIKDYIKLMEQFNKMKEDFKTSPYALQQKTLNINRKRTEDYFKTKDHCLTFFKKLAVILQNIIKDYNSEKRLIQNGDEKLHFEISKGNMKHKFENVTIINAIALSFSFVSGLCFYLTNGKLGRGSGIYIYEEKEKNETVSDTKKVKDTEIDNQKDNIIDKEMLNET